MTDYLGALVHVEVPMVAEYHSYNLSRDGLLWDLKVACYPKSTTNQQNARGN